MKYKAAVKVICLSEETICWLEESLARSREEPRQRQQDLDIAQAEGEKLQSAKREVEEQLRSSRARLVPLEQELAAQVFLTDKSLQARAQREAKRVWRERLRMLREGLTRLVNVE